jgi:site-specific recombinase XerD
MAGGASLLAVKRLLGHASLKTTQIYTRVTIPEIHATFRKTHPRARVRKVMA